MSKLAGIKISLCQMPVVAARPDLNTEYVIKELKKAAERGSDLIIFPEMCVSGYLIGDMFEDKCFIDDVVAKNSEICLATLGITPAIFGSLSAYNDIGEDGRMRISNASFFAANGKLVHQDIKCLQPNYRIFDDDRHFYSKRKSVHEVLELGRKEGRALYVPKNYFRPVEILTSFGQRKIGVLICEDVWDGDYFLKPARFLVDQGIDILVCISCSNWTWQKNRKRDQILRDLAEYGKKVGKPFYTVYVNNTGVQNNGKNNVVFDGSSVIYNGNGEKIFEMEPYFEGTQDFVFSEKMSPLSPKPQNDSKELFDALAYGIRYTYGKMPKPVFIGLSSGIDSCNAAALLTHVLGHKNVVGVYMPYVYSTAEEFLLSKKLAENLGIEYLVKPIGDIVDAVNEQVGSRAGANAFQSMQAVARMMILKGLADERGGIFSANYNKTEAFFGYGTMYGDIAGAVAINGDLWKREVYQIADYMNREIFKRQVIPEKCFIKKPTAGLTIGQVDPFDYGNLNRNGYHDQFGKAVLEFRLNPEDIMDLYLKGELESRFKLEPGSLKKLFPTPQDFVKDLYRCWQLFHGATWKRVRSMENILVSKRGFGWDFRESELPAHFTSRFYELKKKMLARRSEKNVAIYGGKFRPPGLHHLRIAEELVKIFFKVIIVPCGYRIDRPDVNNVDPRKVAEMVEMTFKSLPVTFDFTDTYNDSFTSTYNMQAKFQRKFPGAQIWHVVGGDLVVGGRDGHSEIQEIWDHGREIWNELNFFVVDRPGYGVRIDDLPPSCGEAFRIDGIVGSSTTIRKLFDEGKPISDLVTPEVKEYLKIHGLYIE